jgi:hypothetical protein
VLEKLNLSPRSLNWIGVGVFISGRGSILKEITSSATLQLWCPSIVTNNVAAFFTLINDGTGPCESSNSVRLLP